MAAGVAAKSSWYAGHGRKTRRRRAADSSRAAAVRLQHAEAPQLVIGAAHQTVRRVSQVQRVAELVRGSTERRAEARPAGVAAGGVRPGRRRALRSLANRRPISATLRGHGNRPAAE